MIWPLIWLCTVTVASGVTVPSPMSVIGMSPARALAAITGIGPPPPKRPPAGACVALGVSSQASSAKREQHCHDDEHPPRGENLQPGRPGIRLDRGSYVGVAVFVVHSPMPMPSV